jgi:hypothetical protein
MFYHAYFHSPIKYGIIFWLTDGYSKKSSSKKGDTSIFGIKGCASCSNIFKAQGFNNGFNLYFRIIIFS